MDKTLQTWLKSEFPNENTRKSYRTALRKFKAKLEIADLGEYLIGDPNVLQDMKHFLVLMNGEPPKTISSYANAVKLFLAEHEHKITREEWKQLKRRGHRPKRDRAITRDKINTKEELRRILNYCHIKSKSLFLFLVSSGARLGESLQLKQADLELDAEPVPLAHIRGEYTKGGVGKRTVPLSFEARDCIRDWLACKDTLTKRSGTGDTYAGELVWSYTDEVARLMWNNAVKKAGLDQRDPKTNRRVYHLHSLRKYFRSKIGLDREDREVILGHVGYLDEAYKRFTEADWHKLWVAYAAMISNVSVYEFESQDMKDTVKVLEERIAELEETEAATSEILELFRKLGPEGLQQFNTLLQQLIAKKRV